MKITELRIGNYVNWNRKNDNLPSEPVAVYNITRTTVRAFTGIEELEEIQLNQEDIEGIPLTEDWLKRCGFTYFADNNSWQLDSDLGFKLWGRIDKGFELYIGSDSCGISFKFVHQLQNLYFALTSTELQIK